VAFLGCFLWLLAGVAPALAGPVLNGGFEAGFAGWTTIGITSIETAAFGTGPAGGVQQARMSSGNGAEVGAVTDAALELFLDLAPGSIDAIVTTNDVLFGAREGSAIKQTITGNAGDTLTFRWNFLTSELTPVSDTNDTAFWSLSPLGPTRLADTHSAFVPSATVLDEETGYQAVNFVLPASGSYTLGFAVVDVSDLALGSVLLVDSVALRSVPEPTLALLLGLGAAGAAAMRRARRG
jgi:hypothetical protein